MIYPVKDDLQFPEIWFSVQGKNIYGNIFVLWELQKTQENFDEV